jgi:hypothetical protein
MVPPPPTMIMDVVCCEPVMVEFGGEMGSSVWKILVLEVILREIHYVSFSNLIFSQTHQPVEDTDVGEVNIKRLIHVRMRSLLCLFPNVVSPLVDLVSAGRFNAGSTNNSIL